MEYKTPVLPSHVKTLLLTGAGGFVGQELLRTLLELYPNLSIIATDIRPPSIPNNEHDRVTSLAADLGDESSLASLFEGKRVDGVFALHGIMSGGSEADMELGYRVNVDSHLSLLKAVSKHSKSSGSGTPPLYVYTSGLAVYGGPDCLPEADVDGKTTPLHPETSYGTAKAIMELYVFDFTRKGLIDGRSLRLPTVAIRAGAPSSAASSFISGVIREPLQGQRADCPVANGLDDSNLDDKPVYLSRVKTVIHNIIYSLSIPASSFPAHSRSVNVPGITITTRSILDALTSVGGKEALDLVDFKRDEKVLHIMKSWPGSFKNEEALKLGFIRDDPKTGFESAVKDFAESLERIQSAEASQVEAPDF